MCWFRIMFTAFDLCIILFILLWSVSPFIKVYSITCNLMYPGLPCTLNPPVSRSTLYPVSPLYPGLLYTLYPHVSRPTLYPVSPSVSRSTLYPVSSCI